MIYLPVITPGVTPLNLSQGQQVQDYKHLPRRLPPSKSLSVPFLDTAPSSNPSLNTTTSSFNSTASTSTGSCNHTLESLKLSPLRDDRHSTVCPSPSLTKGLTRIPSVGDLYASPNRTPTAAARAQTLALQQAQREQATLTAKLEEEFYQQKLEQRRAATLQRNLVAHFEAIEKERSGDYNRNNDKRVTCKHMSAVSSAADIESEIPNDDSSVSHSISTSATGVAASSDRMLSTAKSIRMNHHQHHLQHLKLKPYEHQPQQNMINTNQQQDKLKKDLKSVSSQQRPQQQQQQQQQQFRCDAE